MTGLIKNIIVLGGLVALAFFGYYLFVVKDTSELDRSDENKIIEAQNQEFLSRLRELQEINLDNEIFSDPRFRSLTSFGTEIDRVSTGRSNPFSASSISVEDN